MLADALEDGSYICDQAANELRRQDGEINSMRSERIGTEKELRRLHEVNVELLEALEYAIGQVPDLATVPGIASVIAKATGETDEAKLS